MAGAQTRLLIVLVSLVGGFAAANGQVATSEGERRR
jgi:hypothetical protein